jgi:hypothetical protein
MTEIKVSDKDFVTITVLEDGIEISMKYNKRSELKTRFVQLDKFKELLRKV